MKELLCNQGGSIPTIALNGMPELTGLALYGYGDLYLLQGNFKLAAEQFHAMLTVIPQEEPELLARANYGLARTYAAQGNLQEARILGEQSATLLEQIQHRDARAVRQWLASLPT